MPEPIKVVFFQRKPLPIHKSVEFIFADVRSRMPDYVQCLTKVFRFYSKGILQRLYIIWEAYHNQGGINHITGDVHFAAIALTKHKTLMTIHDCRLLSETHGIKHYIFKAFWYTLPLRRCALVTVVSQATKQQLLKYVHYPEDKVHVIPNPISGAFTYHEKHFNSINPVILQVGTTINKNLERLIRALEGIDCTLHLIGALTADIIASLTAGKIRYSNYTNVSHAELVEKYVECDMVSFVSTYEGFGMPIVEANAVGRPVITSNILSMPEVAADAACLVDPFNVEDIRAGILKIIGNEAYRNRLVKNGLENRRRFDPQIIADQYLSLYVQLSGNSKPRPAAHL